MPTPLDALIKNIDVFLQAPSIPLIRCLSEMTTTESLSYSGKWYTRMNRYKIDKFN